MSFLNSGNSGSSDKKKGPSTNRIIVWVLIGGFALYLIGSGIYGLLTN
ncbi:MAG TPA: hypothetical protein VEX88_11470 [Glaciibacter sp.]|nr:hypothetical protein [Glaciibacter sp.]